MNFSGWLVVDSREESIALRTHSLGHFSTNDH